MEKPAWKGHVSFQGDGYIELNTKLISNRTDMNWKLDVKFSTWMPEGLILWQGKYKSRNIFDMDMKALYSDLD